MIVVLLVLILLVLSYGVWTLKTANDNLFFLIQRQYIENDMISEHLRTISYNTSPSYVNDFDE